MRGGGDMEDRVTGVYRCLDIEELVSTTDKGPLEEVSFGSQWPEDTDRGFVSMRVVGHNIGGEFEKGQLVNWTYENPPAISI